MASPRKAREYALQMLYQWELARAEPARIESTFWKAARASEGTRLLANALFEGAAADCAAADQMIARHAQHWRLERIAAIDRSILRLAVHELRRGDTPPKAVINEALELARKFSDVGATGFINGVLDAIYQSLRESPDEPSPP
ncbi:MAG TPA: transcription antitermination factor NusB [Candidatus Acidoferrales bacterium]|nr:transcription antitermination factor NusB [Candidatus Acidoferrales bacterium]